MYCRYVHIVKLFMYIVNFITFLNCNSYKIILSNFNFFLNYCMAIPIITLNILVRSLAHFYGIVLNISPFKLNQNYSDCFVKKKCFSQKNVLIQIEKTRQLVAHLNAKGVMTSNILDSSSANLYKTTFNELVSTFFLTLP